MNLPLEDFVEATYLNFNPDVLEAVQKGHFLSGWQHYLTYGFRENRPGVPAEFQDWIKYICENKATAKVPSNQLRKRGHGAEDLLSFEIVGKMVAFDIYGAINSIPITFNKNCRIFDFGCGCGRIIRYFHKFYEKSMFYGSDIDQEAISWCRGNLSDISEFIVNQDLPHLPFEDSFFDFVYSISTFTHLPEDMQFAWLEELSRVTKTGGHLILTVHGEELFSEFPYRYRRKLKKSGFYYFVGAETKGLPGFYQTAFHTEDYIRTKWSKFFKVIRIIKKGIANNQDLILLRKTE